MKYLFHGFRIYRLPNKTHLVHILFILTNTSTRHIKLLWQSRGFCGLNLYFVAYHLLNHRVFKVFICLVCVIQFQYFRTQKMSPRGQKATDPQKPQIFDHLFK